MSTTLPLEQATATKTRTELVWAGVLAALVVVLYAAVLKGLVGQWWEDSDYSHGFLVPLFSGYVLWRERERWASLRLRPANLGLLVMVGGIGLLLVGSLGAELFTSRFSLLVVLAGMVLYLGGWEALRAVWFPLAFLLLMIPFPTIIFNQITFPLQLLASRLATAGLELVQVPVLREGNVLVLPHYSLEVVEACSGIRSLMTLVTLAVAYGQLAERRRWVRYLLVGLMVPGAIVSNAIRVMGAGVLTHHFGPQMAEGFFHEFSGWVIFLVALVFMFACHGVLRAVGRGRKSAHA